MCVRLDEKWMQFDRLTMEMYSKSYCWSMVKWDKVAFVDVNCMVRRQLDISFRLKKICDRKLLILYIHALNIKQAVKNCDQIFRTESMFATVEENCDYIFVCKPSAQIWGKMEEALWISLNHG
jgi:alpha-N-acetylglucosamine transferase